MSYLDRLDGYKEEMISALGDAIAMKSVLSDEEKGENGEIYPFGKNIHDAFLHTLSMGEKMGFDTLNVDNHGGHIEWKSPENNADVFGISAHVDVVPEGTGWTGDPFKMEEKDGNLYGRGVADDKGPMLACLYAMKALKEEGIIPKKNIRLIIGLDEETEKNGMRYYLDKCGQPTMGFTPDGDFPLVNGEMGILIFDIAQKLNKELIQDGMRLVKLEAGTAPNVVPRFTKAVIAGNEKDYKNLEDTIATYIKDTGNKVTSKKQGSSMVIETEGLAAHGAHPELGLNSISIMMELLGRLDFSNKQINDFISYYNNHIGFDLHGERLNCAFSDEPSGKLILNVGMAKVDDEIASLTLNIRYPVMNKDSEVFEGIEKTLENTQIGIVKNMHEGPIYLSTDEPMVQKMMQAYREETGDTDSQPFVTGGGTYAKMIDKTLAFGALFPNEDDTMHQADERLCIESYYKMARIYAKAIYSICCE